MTKRIRLALALTIGLVAVTSASAERYVYEPISDNDDGHLVDGFNWDPRLANITVDDLLMNLGQIGGSTYDVAVGYSLMDLAENDVVSEVRLRLNEQGGTISSGLTISITGALDLDPLASAGSSRFLLPRTNASVSWNISAAWDSSGQRVAKYEETPDLSSIINELLAQPGWDTSAKNAVIFLEVAGAAGDNVVVLDDSHPAFWNEGNPGIRPPQLIVNETYYDAFWGKELLCRPKPNAMEVNFIPHLPTDAYVEWGTDGLGFPMATATTTVPGATAHEFLMSDLSPDTRYYYRLRYRPTGGGPFEVGTTHDFLTLPLGSEARIVVTSDAHVTNTTALGLSTHLDLLRDTLLYMKNFHPAGAHLWMDLGDLVVTRSLRVSFDAEEVGQRFRQAREFIDLIGHSVPFVLVRGNHEEVNGWDYDSTPNNTAIWSGTALLDWFPPPFPDEFYSGNDVPFPDLGLPGNYFAFNVGNVRVRALDPFLFSTTRPHNGHGETGGSQNGWDWTLGQQQYDWLSDEVSTVHRPFSFTAMHHLTSCYDGPGLWYGRGGIEVAKFSVDGRPSFEWGGEDATGADVYAVERPGFNNGPIHDLLANNGNQVLIKGHDHFHARQELNGMVYVTLAKPNDTGEHTGNLWGWRYSSSYPEPLTIFEENSGFLTLVADDTTATYQYIQTFPSAGLGMVRDTFTVFPATTVGVPEVGGSALRRTWIRKVAPNPSRIPPRIEFEIGLRADVNLSVYDTNGRLVRELVDRPLEPGLHDVTWDGRDRSGRRVGAGMYFAKLRTGNRVDSEKLLILR